MPRFNDLFRELYRERGIPKDRWPWSILTFRELFQRLRHRLLGKS